MNDCITCCDRVAGLQGPVLTALSSPQVKGRHCRCIFGVQEVTCLLNGAWVGVRFRGLPSIWYFLLSPSSPRTENRATADSYAAEQVRLQGEKSLTSPFTKYHLFWSSVRISLIDNCSSISKRFFGSVWPVGSLGSGALPTYVTFSFHSSAPNLLSIGRAQTALLLSLDFKRQRRLWSVNSCDLKPQLCKTRCESQNNCLHRGRREGRAC